MAPTRNRWASANRALSSRHHQGAILLKTVGKDGEGGQKAAVPAATPRKYMWVGIPTHRSDPSAPLPRLRSAPPRGREGAPASGWGCTGAAAGGGPPSVWQYPTAYPLAGRCRWPWEPAPSRPAPVPKAGLVPKPLSLRSRAWETPKPLGKLRQAVPLLYHINHRIPPGFVLSTTIL